MFGAYEIYTFTAHIADIAVTMVRAGVAGAMIGLVVAKDGRSVPAS
jgi:hypothetical protein